MAQLRLRPFSACSTFVSVPNVALAGPLACIRHGFLCGRSRTFAYGLLCVLIYGLPDGFLVLGSPSIKNCLFQCIPLRLVSIHPTGLLYGSKNLCCLEAVMARLEGCLLVGPSWSYLEVVGVVLGSVGAVLR